jgi:hypothetical protein
MLSGYAFSGRNDSCSPAVTNITHSKAYSKPAEMARFAKRAQAENLHSIDICGFVL